LAEVCAALEAARAETTTMTAIADPYCATLIMGSPPNGAAALNDGFRMCEPKLT
jgi:hypothetical protein